MKSMPSIGHDIPSRNMHGHCPIDSLNETCEKFFQIWSHKAANISNDLIEYTIRRMQSDRLRVLFQTRNEYTQQENILPICQILTHTEDDLKRIKEHIRRFCLTTRNVYRHLRSDSRLYPKMLIDLDQGIMIKICRFIFKTKVLIKIFSKEQHLTEQQREKYKIKQTEKHFHINDPYRNITKAFIVLQSNFEILYGNILDRDFFQNAKTAVQTLPIILDISKTIRLIFCELYKLSEPERQAEAEAIRQRRLAFCVHGYGSLKNQGLINTNIPVKNEEKTKFKTMNEILKINQSQLTHTSAITPTKTTNQSKTKNIKNSKRIQSPKTQSRTPNTKISKSIKNGLSSSTPKITNHSSKTSFTKEQKKKKSSNLKAKHQKKSKSKNKNTSITDSTLSNKYNKNTNCHYTQTSSKEKFGWTTWLHNATLRLANILPSNEINLNVNPSKPILTTWASLDRISKI